MVNLGFIVLWFILLSCNFMFSAFDYGKKLYTFPTKYFDFIYSENSKDTALYIASFADDTFEKINAMLKSKHTERFTVVISGDSKEANGYANTSPSYSTIVIYNVQPNVEWTVGNGKEFFKLEFLHELTHAISLNIRSEFLEVMSKIFGNWLWPASTMPLSFMEGVTVSFESLEGYGRVNYPLIKQQIQQDILDGKFRTFPQASGSYDRYLYRANFYHYGGFFSDYLQKKHGMEKYTQLWHQSLEQPLGGLGGVFFLNSDLLSFLAPVSQLGPLVGIVPPFVESLFALGPAFRTVYGTSIEEEWDSFKEQMRYKGNLLLNTNTLSSTRVETEGVQLVTDNVYFLDRFNEEIKAFNLKTQETSTLIAEEGINSFNVRKDGSAMLICRSYNKDRKNETLQVAIQEKNLITGSVRTLSNNDIREAAYCQDGIIGVQIRSHFTDLVFIRNNGEVKVLLKGNEKTIFSSPKEYNSEEAVFLVQDNGKMKVGKVKIETGEAALLEGDISFVRTISAYDGKILFSYNNDMTFYKMAILDGENLTVQTENYSGGVFFPMLYQDDLYYLGKFSDGDQLYVYPKKYKDFKGTPVKAAFIKYQPEPDQTKTYAAIKRDEKNYNPVPYLLPHAWLPIVTFQADYPPWGIDGAGIYTIMKDPYSHNSLSVMASYNFIRPFANVTLYWDSTTFPIHFTLNGYDKLVYNFSLYYDYVRYTGATLDLNYTFNFISPNQYLKIGEIVGYSQQSLDFNYLTGTSVASSPYSWIYIKDPSMLFTTYFKLAGYTIFHPYKLYDVMRGFTLDTYFDLSYSLQPPNSYNYKIESIWTWYPYYIPLIVKLSGGFSPVIGFMPYGNLGFVNNRYLSMPEYSKVLLFGNYYASADISYQFLNFEIQQGLVWPPIYFNRLYVTAGYRAAYLAPEYTLNFNDYYLQTGYVRADLVVPMLSGSDGLAAYKVNAYIEGHYAISTATFGYQWNLDFSKQFGKD